MWRRSRSSPSRSSSTSEAGRAPAALPVALFVAFAAAVAGCSAFESLRPQPAAKPAAAAAAPKAAKPEPAKHVPFDHKLHLDKGVSCDDCHEGTEKADKAPMPTAEFCMNCHVDIDDKKPLDRTVAGFLDKPGGTPVWSKVTEQAPGIVFSHKAHVAKKVECAECHKGIDASTAVTKQLFTDMDACMACHTAKKAKNECSTCHRESQESVKAGKGQYWPPANHGKTWPTEHGSIAKAGKPANRAEQCDLCHGKEAGTSSCTQCHATTKPKDHERLWARQHGQTVRGDPDAVTGRCAFCHEAPGFPREAKYTGCHATQAPRDHSQSWRVNAGHGLAAALDRERCEVCHKTDSCVACHSSMAPRNHRGGWGSARNTHCAGCHLPLDADEPGGCGTCHQGTPSHSAAPNMPSQPPHRPDMQCRQCHNRPPKLKHFDNGTNCLICHK
jgi:c(7)-type cytochrome triheme protein